MDVNFTVEVGDEISLFWPQRDNKRLDSEKATVSRLTPKRIYIKDNFNWEYYCDRGSKRCLSASRKGYCIGLITPEDEAKWADEKAKREARIAASKERQERESREWEERRQKWATETIEAIEAAPDIEAKKKILLERRA
jgi:hypothetical protein